MECEQTQTLVVLTDIKIQKPYVDNIGKTTPSSLLATRYLHFGVKCDFIKLLGSAQPGAPSFIPSFCKLGMLFKGQYAVIRMIENHCQVPSK